MLNLVTVASVIFRHRVERYTYRLTDKTNGCNLAPLHVHALVY